MKTMTTLKALLLILVTSTALSSCDFGVDYISPDREQSAAFAGQWTGDFGMYYNYRYNGRMLTFDSYDTDIVFYPEYSGARYGWGKQVDYYPNGPYESIYHRFNWEIRDGVVYLDYPSDPSLNANIYNYRMTSNVFYGTFGSSNEKFSLRKIVDYYDWTPYVDTSSYYDRVDWYSSYSPYYSKSRSGAKKGATPNDSLLTTPDSTPKTNGIVNFGKR